ncbi:MAG TPA: hypothetical protein VM581_01065, partial [Magnetospirillaceae bacterium]|nr:hypothetical protein [Magnetospirillaceae bacterium]
MKAKRFIVSIGGVLLLCAPVSALAQDATSARQQIIVSQCQALGSLLDQLQRRDLVARTNLGREHENIARQLAAFNQRMKHNNLNAAPYEQLLGELNGATSQFRETYVRYDDRMNELRQINCRTEPGLFESKLAETRALR